MRIVALTPSEDGEVEIAALDEEPLYYGAPLLDSAVPLPLLVRRTPRVLSGLVTERLIRAGAGFATELELTLTVAGDWRTATVSVAEGSRPYRVIARLIDGDTVTRWISPPSGTISVRVVPGSSPAPAGPAWSTSYTISGALAPPGPPTNFLVDVLSDGTRRFRWTPPSDVDLAGIQIRAKADAEAAIAWDSMRPMHKGLLLVSPWETFEPPAGQWVFVARARDTGGRWSEAEARIVASLGAQRLLNVLVWECPAAEGWPGTVTGVLRSDDGRDALEAVGAYRWSDLTTWDAWTSWGLGDGTQGGMYVTYQTAPYDIGSEFDAGLFWRWDGELIGTVTMHIRSAARLANINHASWILASNRPFIHRWIQIRWGLIGTGAELLSMDHLCWSLHGPVRVHRMNDRRIDSFASHTVSVDGSAEVPVPAPPLHPRGDGRRCHNPGRGGGGELGGEAETPPLSDWSSPA